VTALGGTYRTAGDMNITPADLDIVAERCKWVYGTTSAGGNSGRGTARGVLHGIRASVEHAFGSQDLSGRTVLVQGVGSVGHDLARYLRDDGAHVLVADVAEGQAQHVAADTGAELVAAAIHFGSARKDRPFVRVNCAAIPRDLVESEMFGHEKGSFTGATERRIGRFELAHTGTLFLDEVGDLGAEAQAKLLRAIEAREIERVGGGKPIRVDVRIVSATNRDFARAVAEGTFREDLLFRLNVIPINVPPLRERPDDIPALVRHFSLLHQARTGRRPPQWTPGALALLARYRWPGNVRELANIVERLAILHAGAEVDEADVRSVLPMDGSRPAAAPLPDPTQLDGSLSDTLDGHERTLIIRALSAAGGNVAEAARRLRTDRANLYRRMRRLGIPVGEE